MGKFSVVREIGRGGMCFVYEARHLDLNKTVAVKTLKPEFAAQPEVIERFIREGRAASRIRHRHAIDMIDVGEHDGIVYLAMEYLEGEDLSQRIKRLGPLSAQAAVDTLLPVMAAIVEAHEAGVVHRDLKPANIFLAVDRRGNVEPKVLDFGISKVAHDDAQHQTATEALLGTPYFMAPEQVQGARYTSPASDQWSLGVILFQCLTGALPFRGASTFDTLQAIVVGRYTSPRTLAPSIPVELEAVVARALRLHPLERFASVADMGAALLPFASPGLGAFWAPTFASGERAEGKSPPAPLPPGLPIAGGTITQASKVIPRAEHPRASSEIRYAIVGVGVVLVAASIMIARSIRSTASGSPVVMVQPLTPDAARQSPPLDAALRLPPAPDAPPHQTAAPTLNVIQPPPSSVPVRPAALSRTHTRQRTPERPSATERDRHGTLLIR